MTEYLTTNHTKTLSPPLRDHKKRGFKRIKKNHIRFIHQYHLIFSLLFNKIFNHIALILFKTIKFPLTKYGSQK